MRSEPLSCLFVLRHAHSSWALPGQRDHQRPLDERGREEVPKIAAAVAEAGYRIEAVVCSTATRAVETLDGMRPVLAASVQEAQSDDLYALGTDAYYEIAKAGTTRSLMLVGHNPMIEDFTIGLCAEGEPAAMDALKRGFPTAGLAVIEFASPLRMIEPGSGYLRRLLAPTDL